MKEQLPGIFIFAANGRESEAIEELKSLEVEWKEVEGVYKGIKERSFVVNDTGPHVEPLIRQMARKYLQESYLKSLSNTRATMICYLEGPQVGLTEYIGYLEQVPKSYALTKDAYTRDGNVYYVAE